MEAGAKGADGLVSGMAGCGFQASHLAHAVDLIAEMKQQGSTIFLAFTANLVASGLRGLVRELCERKFIDAIVTTAGGVDHDIIKNFGSYTLGSFDADDAELHRKGINRIGNIFLETKHFELLEEKMQKWFSEIYAKQKIISPSGLNSFIGSKLGNSSFLHTCWKNKIPVFCPGITDGAIGLQMYFFRQKHRDFVVDVGADLKPMGDLVLNAEKTGAIILGGGISKHHVIGANILRDGLDYAVYISTAPEHDGSLSGARTREAKSWGKLKETGESVNVVADATIAFPLICEALKNRGILK